MRLEGGEWFQSEVQDGLKSQQMNESKHIMTVIVKILIVKID